jgi:hypothetical protein
MHTKGPWNYAGSCEPIEREPGVSVEQVWQGGRVIAEVMTTEESTLGVDEGWSNARLIAAAPEMFAACESLLARFEKSKRDYMPRPLDQDEWIVRLQSIIAKARGEHCHKCGSPVEDKRLRYCDAHASGLDSRGYDSDGNRREYW